MSDTFGQEGNNLMSFRQMVFWCRWLLDGRLMMHTFSLYNIILDGALNMAALIPMDILLGDQSISNGRNLLVAFVERPSSSHTRQNTRIHIGYAGVMTENE